MPNPIDDARSLIQSRLADLDAEAKSLERALASLGEGGKAPRRGSGRPRKVAAAAISAPAKPKRRTTRRRKRAPRAQRREQFLAAVKAKRGARVSELAREIGISPNQGHALAKRLHKEGAIRKSGKGYALKKG